MYVLDVISFHISSSVARALLQLAHLRRIAHVAGVAARPVDIAALGARPVLGGEETLQRIILETENRTNPLVSAHKWDENDKMRRKKATIKVVARNW